MKKAGLTQTNKIKCHSRACRPQDSGIPTALNNAKGGDPRLQSSGMTLLNVGQVLPDNAPIKGHPSTFTSGGKHFNCQVGPDLHQGNKRGFTLIELLVVVLLIGILAAVALPQYQKAVKKATLAAHIDMARVLKNAEELFFLEHGTYTANLGELAITLPFTEDCIPGTSAAGITNTYTCGYSKFGIFQINNPTNAQAGDDTIRYTLFFRDRDPFKKGDIVCYSKGTLARDVCRSLGEGTEYPAENDSSWTYYVLK